MRTVVIDNNISLKLIASVSFHNSVVNLKNIDYFFILRDSISVSHESNFKSSLLKVLDNLVKENPGKSSF